MEKVHFLNRFTRSLAVSELLKDLNYEEVSKITTAILEAKLLQEELGDSLDTPPSLGAVLAKMETNYFTSFSSLKEYFRVRDGLDFPQ